MINRFINKIIILLNSIFFRFNSIMKGSSISFFAELRIEKDGKLVIGKNSKITRGTIVHISRNATLSIGNNVWIGPYNVIYCNEDISIGMNSRISHFCTVTDNDYKIFTGDNAKIDFSRKNTTQIRIGENTWIGANSIILRGSIIDEHTVIPAGSCVRRK